MGRMMGDFGSLDWFVVGMVVGGCAGATVSVAWAVLCAWLGSSLALLAHLFIVDVLLPWRSRL